jgi:iron(III) transport system substrate-binding protein
VNLRNVLFGVATTLVGLGLVAGCERDAANSGDAWDLVIITPHNENIQKEFEAAFVERVGRPLKIRWLKKGTGQIIQQLDAQERAVQGGTFDIDVFFGGGVPDLDLAASRGYLQSPDLPAEVIDEIPPEIAGVANYDSRRLWFGSALSSFGVLVNKRGLESQQLPMIEEWDDLAAPEMYGWVVIADPRHSSSVRVCYELILQQYGWAEGWPLLMRIAANSRTITSSSSAVPNEVATGNVLAGPCIDFYAYARVAQAGEDVLAYVNPKGGSAITPDPIAMLRKPPHQAMAERFIAFVMSVDGQKLWMLPAGVAGGPREHALFRMPVRPDVCQQHADELLIKDPYAEAASGSFRKMDGALQTNRNPLLAALMGAAVVDLHADAKQAWKAVIDGGMKPAALDEWNKLPFDEEESLRIAKQLETGDAEARRLTRDWTTWFKAKYDRVKELAN